MTAVSTVAGSECGAKTSEKVDVTVNQRPSANFSFTNNACSGNNVQFTNTSTGNGLVYTWNFGDPTSGNSNTSSDPNPRHAFSSIGSGVTSYSVRLTVTTPDGCSDSETKSITIKQQPDIVISDLTRTAPNPAFTKCNSTSVNSNYLLRIQNRSNYQDNTSYSISWGDGSVGQNLSTFTEAQHTYTSQGYFTLRITATNNGCSTTWTQQVYNGSNPKISIGNPGSTLGCAPVKFGFPVADVEDNSAATTYTFQVNDGSPAQVFTQDNVPSVVYHTFNASSCASPNKEFTLTATATNPCGTSTIDVKSIRIGKKPTANIEIAPAKLEGCINDVYNFADVSDQGIEAVSNATCTTEFTEHTWEISPATGWQIVSGGKFLRNMSVRFTEAGQYTIKFNIKNGCGSSEIQKTIKIVAPPVSKFTTSLNPTSGCRNLTVSTANQSTGEFLTYKWTVAPNTGYTVTSGSLTSATPTFNFTSSGVYTISLEAINPCGSNTSSTQVTVKAPPTVSLPDAKDYCGPQTIAFSASNAPHIPTYVTNLGPITAYNWTVTGGTGATFVSPSSATSQYPTINFANPGTFTVSVTATNECGISVAASQQILIRELPNPPTVAGKIICEGSVAGLSVSNPITGAAYRWYLVATGGATVITGATYNPTLTNTTTFYVEVTDQFGCTSATRTPVTVTVNKQITNNTLTTPTPSTICEGETPKTITGSQPTGGDGATYTYIWQTSTNNSIFSNAPGGNTTQNYIPGALTQTTYFRRIVTSGLCSASPSNTVTITVTPRPTAPAISGVTICSGATAALSVSSPGTGHTFRWYKETAGGTAVGTGSSYATPALTATTTYYVESVSNNCPSFTRTAVTVTVTPAITSNAISGIQDICSGQPSLQIVGQPAVGGTEAFTYRWEQSQSSASDGFTAAVGTNNVLSYTPGTLTTTTWYRRIAASGACTSISNVVQLTVRPVISNNTVSNSQTICAGAAPATLVGSAPQGGNNTYTYKWLLSTTSATADYNEITGATASNYQPMALNVTTWFRRVVSSGACDTQESAPVQIMVQQTIVNNAITGEQIICRDQPASVLIGSVPAGGSGSYVYQWQSSSTENGTYTSVAGATAVNLTFSAGQSPIVTTWYRRVVTAGYCAPSNSNAVRITVNPAIINNTITNGTAQVICTGSSPVAFLGATPGGGDGTHLYQWQISSNSTTFSDITSATGKDYDPGNLTTGTYWFRRAVTSGGCTAQSAAVQVTVQALITNNTIGSNQNICSGSIPAQFNGSVPAGGSGTYAFQWQSSTNGVDYFPITGATAQNYQTPAQTTSTWYRRVVSSGACAAVTSDAIKVEVTAPIINNTLSIAEATICAGTAPATAILGANPTGGTETFTFVWEISTTSSTAGFTVIDNATGKDYTAGVLNQTTWFRRRASSGACTVISAALQITIQMPATNNTITTGPQDLCAGSAATTLIGSTPSAGTGTYTYVWESSTTSANTGFTSITGATAKDYTPGVLSQTTWFRRKVFSGACPEITSTAIEIKITNAITENIVGADQTICAGTRPANIGGSTPQGGNNSFTYQWQVSINGSTYINITGATGKEYHPEALSVTTWYKRIVTSGACTVASTAMKVTVTPLPAAPTVTGKIICANTSTSLTASGAADMFRWYTSATGGTSFFDGATYITPVLTQTTTYYVETVKADCASATRTAVTVTVEQTITNNTINAAQIICVGSTPQGLTGTTPAGGSGAFVYRWESSTDGVAFTTISGATSTTYSPGALNETTWYRRVITSGVCVASTSEAVKVTANPAITNNTINTVAPICSGQVPPLVTGNVPAGGDGSYVFGWESSTTSATAGFATINGANGADYQSVALTATTWLRRVVSSGGCSVISSAVRVEVQQPITNNTISAAQDICSGSAPAAITGLTPTGGAALGSFATYTFRWESSTTSSATGFTTIAGATASNYAPGVLTETTWYRRVVIAGVCTESISDAIQIHVTAPITTNTLSADQTICSTSTPTLVVGTQPTGGNGITYTYSWESSITSATTGFTAIANANGKDYQPGALTATTWYRRKVTSGACTEISAVMQVTVTPLPAAPTAAGKTICAGSTASLTASGGAGDTYRWYAVATAGPVLFEGATFVTPALTQTTTYYVETIKDNCASAVRTAVVITVEQPITANTISTNQEICEGATPQGFTGSMPTGGTGTYTFVWERSIDGLVFTAITNSNTKDHASGPLAQTTWFRRKVTSGVCDASLSPEIKVTVNAGITGNAISAVQTICAGQAPQKLTGGAIAGGGTGYTYQWQISTDNTTFTDISGATAAEYAPGILNETRWYRRLVISGGCSSTSNEIKIEVQQPIVGNTISAAQVICSGSVPAALMGAAPTGGVQTGGAATYSYEWQSSADGLTYTTLAGAIARDYSPGTLTQSTWYRRIVRAGVCTESISAAVKIEVTQPITANTLSADQIICANTVPFKITGSSPAGGNNTFTYIWQESADGLNYTNIAGATEKDYQPGTLTATTWYRRVVTSVACTVTSQAMKVMVTPLPAAPGIAVASVTTICAGFTTTLTATGPAEKYLWYAAATGGTALYDGPSFQTPSLTQTTTYYVEAIKDNCASATRTSVTVTVEQLIANNTVAAPQVICAGAIPTSLTGTLPSGGTGTYSYRWEMSTSNATTGFTIIANATAQDYAPGPLNMPTWFRRVAISGVCAESVSAAIAIQVNPGITNNTIAGNQRVCIGSAPTTKLTGLVPAGGDAAYTYRWESSTVSASDGFVTAAGTNNAQDYQPSVLTQTTWYRRVVISGGCTNYSEAVQVLVDPLPNPPVAANKVICTGFTATLAVSSPMATGKYEWFTVNTGGAPVAEGVTFETEVLTSTIITTKTYYVQVTDDKGCVSPRTAVVVTINPVIASNTVSAHQEICSGVVPQPLAGTNPTGGDGTYAYLWEFSTDNSTFSSAPGLNTGKDYAPGALNVTTWYRRKITSGGCENTSPTVQIVVNSPIANNVVSPEQDICEGDTPVLLTATNPSGGNNQYTYRWESNTIGPLGDFRTAAGVATNESYQSAALAQTTWFRRVVISGGCESVSAAIVVTIRESIKNNQVAASQVICFGNAPADLIGSLPTGGNGLYEYVWEASTLSATTGFAPAAGDNTQQNYNPGIMTQTTWFRRVVKAGTSCPAVTSSAIQITLNEAITNNSITTPQLICTGTRPAGLTGTTPAGGSGSYTYQWQVSYSGLNDFVPAEGLNSEANYAPPVLTRNTWFRRIVLSAPCPAQASNMVMITVNPLITNNVVQSAQTVCENTAPALFLGLAPGGGDGTYSYLWQVSETGPTSGFTAASGDNTEINYQAPVLTKNTWFRRVVMSGNCTDISVAVQVTVNKNIANNVVTDDQEICIGATPMPLTGTLPTGGKGNYTYLWESSIEGPNSGFGPARGVNTASTYMPELVLQTTWFRRVVSAGPCDPHYSGSVRIRINPPISNNRVSFNQAICAGALPAALTGTLPQGGNDAYTYLWEESVTGPNSGWRPAEGANNTANYQPAYLTRPTWFRRTVFSGGCNNTSAYLQINVLPALTNNLISAEQFICRGDLPQAINGVQPAGGTGTYTYLWERSTDGFTYTAAIGDNTGLNYRPGPLSVSTWFRRVVTSSPCAEDISDPVKITVAEPLSNNIIISDQSICAGVAPNLLQGSMPAGGGSGYTYLWEISTNGPLVGFTPAPGINNVQDYQPAVLTQSTWFRRVVASLPCQNQTSAVVQITVNPLPAAPVWQNPGARICPGFTALLRVNNPGQQVEWYEQAQGGTVIHVGVSFITPALTETTTYYVQTVSAQGCTSASRTAIRVEVVAPLANAGPDVTIIQGRTTQLRASGGVRYVWSPAVGLSSPNTAVTQAKPDETTTYTVTVTSAEGCVDTDEVTVTVLPKVFIPNVITQNKDGINDDWEILNIEHYPNCRVEVFTRWGAKIFSSEGYQTRWDGTYQGKPLPVSAYYYILYLDKDEAPMSGSVTIIK